MIYEFAQQGKSNVEIASLMAEKFPADWSAKNAHRTVANILSKREELSKNQVVSKTLDEMTREERLKYITARLETTPRFRMALRNFTLEDKSVFIDEYLNAMRATETLTEVEEQALFASILEYILAFQALNRKEKEEQWRDQSLSGEIQETDPRYRRHVDKKYQEEYDQHMKLYQKGMEQLKMSRKDRLHEVRSQKQSLVDLADVMSSKSAQTEVAVEVERLSKLKDEELKRLVDSGYLHGVFEDFE